MRSGIDAALEKRLAAWMDAVRLRARAVVLATTAVTLGLAAYTALTLGINSDNLSLISDRLPSKVDYDRFSALFPTLDNALFIVVDGETPELARDATDALTDSLSRTEQFTDVYVPRAVEFFEEHGLLFLTLDELDDLADQMARLQPLIAELEREASLASLARLVRQGIDEAQGDEELASEWSSILDRVAHAALAVFDEHAVPVSWEEILLERSSIDTVTRRLIVAHPRLDASNLLLAGDAIAAIRQSASELGLEAESGVTVRVTGNPALNYDEMVGVARDIGMAGVFCFALVAFVLKLALRSWRLVTACLVTLLFGLVWTAAFAAAAVGELNLISIAFAILFIGLGVDFGIHLGMCYADLLRGSGDHAGALRGACQRVGSSLVLCAVTTSIGFYVFVPTAYRGVAELGLISGTGMFVILFLTLTLFPALICSWLRVDPHGLSGELRFRMIGVGLAARHAGAVRVAALIAFLLALAVLPRARFEANVVRMRDPSSESVQAMNDLLADRQTVWSVDVLTPDLESAVQLAERLSGLERVDFAVTQADYVPKDQDEKRALLEEVRWLIETPPGPPSERSDGSPAVQRQALAELVAFLAALDLEPSPLRDSVRRLESRLREFLARSGDNGNQAAELARLEDLLLGRLTEQLARLRRSLEPSLVTLDGLPDELARTTRARDGTARIQVYPATDLSEGYALVAFVDEVRSLAPRATGVPVNLVEFGRATTASFLQAMLSATAAISLLLLLLWQRIGDSLLALAPVLMSGALTGASVVLVGMPFNFANVIVLPLLMGIGVDSAIHLVHRARSEGEGLAGAEGSGLLSTTTARAVFYSALTTTVSFGSLALSSHNGIHSLGLLLAVGMVFTVVCNLIVLPALIALKSPRPGGSP